VVAIARRQGGVAHERVRWLVLDIASFTSTRAWQPHLDGIDAVVNCAGALQEGPGDRLRGVHVDGIAALYRACENEGVRRVVHLSAIGADREALTPFSATKRSGEEALRECDLDWVILRPSVVLGTAAQGGSALLRGLAGLPVLLEFPDAGPLQVVQLEQVVDTIVLFLAPDAPARVAFDVAGPERLALTDVVLAYRRWLGFPQPRSVRLPRPLASIGYRLGDLARALGWKPPIGSTARSELTRGAVGDSSIWVELTGIEPRSLASAFARQPPSQQERWFARLFFVRPLVLAILVAFWVATGLVSLGPGWEIGLAYLREGGVPATLARIGVVAGACADILIGLGIAWRATARRALYAALAISIFYMIAGTIVLPRLWADPIGPMLKIWPIMALNIVALATVDDR
jgi:uncharacterized protein YbjT (DUF2867 family)